MHACKFKSPYIYSEKIEWFKVTFLKIEWCNEPLEPPSTGALINTALKKYCLEFHIFIHFFKCPPFQLYHPLPLSYPVGQQLFAIQLQNGQKESFVINLGQPFQKGFFIHPL